jgi:hypothetical protein
MTHVTVASDFPYKNVLRIASYLFLSDSLPVPLPSAFFTLPMFCPA